jgi:hypothetical protein
MMKFIVLGSLFATLAAASLALCQEPGQRQYYTEWKKHTTKPYYYRSYYFKKSAKDENYTYHYCIYFPSRGKRIYMYNPESKLYWGYWEGDKYALLPEKKRKTSIDDIALEDFSPLGAPPNIPGIEEKLAMLPPPKDFPQVEGKKIGGRKMDQLNKSDGSPQ